MEVFFGLNKNVGKSQDVQAWKKPRRDLNALEWLFVTRCRALRWERLPQPATAPRRQRQMRTCDKNQGTGRLCLGDDNVYHGWLSHQQTSALGEGNGSVPGRTWGGLRAGVSPTGHSRTSSTSSAATSTRSRPHHASSKSSALPPGPDKLPNSCSISRLQTLSRVSSKSECICWN